MSIRLRCPSRFLYRRPRANVDSAPGARLAAGVTCPLPWPRRPPQEGAVISRGELWTGTGEGRLNIARRSWAGSDRRRISGNGSARIKAGSCIIRRTTPLPDVAIRAVRRPRRATRCRHQRASVRSRRFASAQADRRSAGSRAGRSGRVPRSSATLSGPPG